MELVPADVSEKDLRDEVNLRTHRAGYTDRDGQPMVRGGIRSRWSRGYAERFAKVFGNRKEKD